MLKWLNNTETDYEIKLINDGDREITVKQKDNIIFFNNTEQFDYDGLKKTKKLLKEGFVLKIDTFDKYKHILNVNIGRNYAFAEAIVKDFNKYWKFSKIDKDTITKKEFARTVKLNFEIDFYEILFRYKHKPLNDFCEFLKSQLSISKEIDNELLNIVTKEIAFESKKENITIEHFKLWVKHWEIIKESDLNDPRLVKLVNWYQKISGSNLRVLLSDIDGSGYGLFTNKKIPKNSQICDYGGNVSRTHLNEFESDQDKSAYTMTIIHEDSVLFYGWTVDSKTCFSIWQVGRWGNALPLVKENNAQFEVYYEETFLKGFPSIKVYSTKEILPYTEIYIYYGKDYDLRKYQKEQALKEEEEKRREILDRVDTEDLKDYFKIKTLELFKQYAEIYAERPFDYTYMYNQFQNFTRESYYREQNSIGEDGMVTSYIDKLKDVTNQKKTFWKKFAKNDGKQLKI